MAQALALSDGIETADRAEEQLKVVEPGSDRARGLERFASDARIKASIYRSKVQARPSQGWLGLMTRGLPDLPDIDRPRREEFASMNKYRFLPALCAMAVLLIVMEVVTALPAFRTSPVSAATEAAGGDSTSVLKWINIGLLVVVMAALIFVGPRKFYNFFYEAALDEEIWFRLGAENFAVGQRIRSCAQFGVAHFLNLIVAVATLGAIGLAGGVFMWVYLREYKASGDPRRAVATSARFHANYNMAVIVMLASIVALAMALGQLV